MYLHPEQSSKRIAVCWLELGKGVLAIRITVLKIRKVTLS